MLTVNQGAVLTGTSQYSTPYQSYEPSYQTPHYTPAYSSHEAYGTSGGYDAYSHWQQTPEYPPQTLKQLPPPQGQVSPRAYHALAARPNGAPPKPSIGSKWLSAAKPSAVTAVNAHNSRAREQRPAAPPAPTGQWPPVLTDSRHENVSDCGRANLPRQPERYADPDLHRTIAAWISQLQWDGPAPYDPSDPLRPAPVRPQPYNYSHSYGYQDQSHGWQQPQSQYATPSYASNAYPATYSYGSYYATPASGPSHGNEYGYGEPAMPLPSGYGQPPQSSEYSYNNNPGSVSYAQNWGDYYGAAPAASGYSYAR